MEKLNERIAEFMNKLELCNSQKELDRLCQKECLLYEISAFIKEEVYIKRCDIINKIGPSI